MDLQAVIDRFRHNAEAIRGLAGGVSRKQARWRPAPNAWSILEVICHLADEEREDFRKRVDLTLHRPDADWPPIDPQAWIEGRAYNRRDLDEALDDFRSERDRSIAWLRALVHPDWRSTKTHPSLPDLRAGDLLASWLAHDQLHLRQLTELHYAWNEHKMRPFDVGYAGEW